MTSRHNGAIIPATAAHAIMQLAKQSPGQRNAIRAYAAGRIQIGERQITASCLISAEHIVEHWSAHSASELTLELLTEALAWRPEVILLGSSTRAVFPPASVAAAIMARGIGLEAMELGAACRTYNVLLSEDRRVVAALIL